MARKAILFDSYSFMTCLRTYIHKLVYLFLLHILYFTTLRYYGGNDRPKKGGSTYIGVNVDILCFCSKLDHQQFAILYYFSSLRFSYNIVCESEVRVWLSDI